MAQSMIVELKYVKANNMNRREILKYAALVTGTAICAPMTLAMLSGCSPQPTGPNATSEGSEDLGQFFSNADLTLLTQIMDVILPKTDTPSPSEVGVPLIIDNMFANVYEVSYQEKFMTLFAELRTHLGNFTDVNTTQQLAMLRELETLPADRRDNAYWAYIDIKQQCVAFYLSTEQVAENHLNYLPIPGQYKPCVSLDELNGKAWAI
jgi:hypothetical protein